MSTYEVPVIGIIGGIGSGKTSIGRALGKQMRVCLLDADAAGHDVLKQQEVKNQIKESFGSEVFDDSGEILRPKLAAKVFGKSQEHQAARKQLDSITHPRIRELLKKQLNEFQENKFCDVIILDAALLLEAGWSEICQAIIFLEVPEANRLERVKQRGWSEEEFAKREASQLNLNEKRNQSDVIIQNDGDVNDSSKELADWLVDRFKLNTNHLSQSEQTE